MGNAQSNAGAAKFFGGIADIATKPFNMASQILVGKPIIPSASQAIANDPQYNPQAQKTEQIGQTPLSFGMIQGQGPMCAMDMSPASIACRSGGQGGNPFSGMQFAMAANTGVNPNPQGGAVPYYSNAPVNTQPSTIGQQQNPASGATGVAAPGGATTMGATQQSATQGMPAVTATPPPAAASGAMPALDNTTMLMMAGGVALAAVFIAKKK